MARPRRLPVALLGVVVLGAPLAADAAQPPGGVAPAAPPAALPSEPPSGASSAAPSPPLPRGRPFVLDPVTDGVIIATGAAFSGVLTVVLGSGEIRPQALSPGAVDSLPGIDRSAATQPVDPHAGTFSDAALYGAMGFALLDTGLSGLRDGGRAALVDGTLYAESLSLTFALTDLTKIAVRRPRPVDYLRCASGTAGSCASTDLTLSFFSGHAATVGTIAATASYLAFVRAGPRSPRPWLTLAAGLGLTAFVSYERVRAGAHFPTDVLAGSLVGAGIGVLVPHLHRHRDEAPPVLLGVAPVPGGSELTVHGLF